LLGSEKGSKIRETWASFIHRLTVLDWGTGKQIRQKRQKGQQEAFLPFLPLFAFFASCHFN
jgi:hypothetical protein